MTHRDPELALLNALGDALRKEQDDPINTALLRLVEGTASAQERKHLEEWAAGSAERARILQHFQPLEPARLQSIAEFVADRMLNRAESGATVAQPGAAALPRPADIAVPTRSSASGSDTGTGPAKRRPPSFAAGWGLAWIAGMAVAAAIWLFGYYARSAELPAYTLEIVSSHETMRHHDSIQVDPFVVDGSAGIELVLRPSTEVKHPQDLALRVILSRGSETRLLETQTKIASSGSMKVVIPPLAASQTVAAHGPSRLMLLVGRKEVLEGLARNPWPTTVERRSGYQLLELRLRTPGSPPQP